MILYQYLLKEKLKYNRVIIYILNIDFFMIE